MRSTIARFAMRRRATAVGALILVFVMAGTALAASRGNAWRLGYVETLSGYVTGITGIHTAELLRIANTNTSSGARAIRAESRSAAAGTIYAKNSGGGPAAEFVTNAGKAPFKVNRTTRVVNLNADLVDGLHANAFRRATLPAGASESGVWGATAGNGSYDLSVINFRSLLAAPLDEGHVHYVTTFTTECPAYGQAAPGHLCVYERFTNSIAFQYFFNPEAYATGAGTTGTTIYFLSSSTVGNALGVWTVTAPTATTTSSGSTREPSGVHLKGTPLE